MKNKNGFLVQNDNETLIEASFFREKKSDARLHYPKRPIANFQKLSKALLDRQLIFSTNNIIVIVSQVVSHTNTSIGRNDTAGRMCTSV